MSVFICSIIPQEVVVKNNVSQASVLFCRKIIKTGYFNKILSILPITVNEPIFIESGNRNIVNIQSRYFKHLSIGRYLNASMETIKALKYCKGENYIWFYNINNQNILLYITLRYFTNKKVFILLADFTPPVRTFSLSKFVEYLIEHSDGIISLSERSTIQHKNTISIPGIIEPLPNQFNSSNDNNTITRNKFLFSGYLGKVTGIDLALKYFSKHPQYLLFITGRGEYADKVKEFSNRFTNIRYLGFIDYDRYEELLINIDFCLNFRNPYLPENLNNFPSKVLEYFSYNKIVISTMLYPELDNTNYLYTDYSESGIEDAMLKIIKTSDSELLAFRKNNETVMANYSFVKWIKSFTEIERCSKKM